MLRSSRLIRLCAVALLLGCVPFIGTGCSREERVKIINHFGQPIRIRLHGRDAEPVIPANSEAFLHGGYVLSGAPARVVVLTEQGHPLKKEEFINIPGDSAFRSFATIEVHP